MNYGSICSGVEAATLAWKPLGWTAKFFAEVEPFPSAVLQQKFGATKPLRPLSPETADGDKDRKERETWAKQIAELPDGGSVPNLGDFTQIMMEQLTLLSAVRPASRTALPDYGRDSPTREATSPSNLLNWLTAQGFAGRSGKTFPASFLAEAEKILPASYRCSADGKLMSPKTDGESAESSLPPPDASDWHGAYLTLNIPEFPNFQGQSRSDGDVSSLSDILVRGSIPPKYYLTEKCAEGILRRAERRGRPLPPVLKAALLRQTRSGCAAASPAAARAL